MKEPGPAAPGGPKEEEVFRFIRDGIDSVPHIEALLLFWNSRPEVGSVADAGEWLYVGPDVVRGIHQDLARRRLIGAAAGYQDRFCYESDEKKDRLINAVAATYRCELVRVSTFIHSKPPLAVREFARVFRFTKERQ